MNTRIITFSSFILAGMAVMGIFLTATTYTQLGIAVALYPVIIYFAFKAFPRGEKEKVASESHAAVITPPQVQIKQKVKEEEVNTQVNQTDSFIVSDINKRAFLKLVGATGLSFFLISIFGRRVESFFVGQNLVQAPVTNVNSPAGQTAYASSSPTDGYNISEINDGLIGYYGFINKKGSWFVMQADTNTGSYRYARGESNFPGNWKNRESLKYDYFYKVFP